MQGEQMKSQLLSSKLHSLDTNSSLDYVLMNLYQPLVIKFGMIKVCFTFRQHSALTSSRTFLEVEAWLWTWPVHYCYPYAGRCYFSRLQVHDIRWLALRECVESKYESLVLRPHSATMFTIPAYPGPPAVVISCEKRLLTWPWAPIAAVDASPAVSWIRPILRFWALIAWKQCGTSKFC